MVELRRLDSLDKMTATWYCEECGESVQDWSYWDMVIKGHPVCPYCDNHNMYCDLQSGEMKD